MRRGALIVVGAAVLLAVFAAFYGWLPWWIDGTRLRHLTVKDQTDALSSDRGDVLKMVAGAGALVALIYTARKHALDRKAHALSEQGQVTDRYTKAIGQLASDRLSERIGGIYALERVMADSERDHPTVVEVLAAFVRQRASLTAAARSGSANGAGNGESETESASEAGERPEADVQAAMTVLARRPERDEPFALDLRRTALAGLELPDGARLAKVNLAAANLAGAQLSTATLTRANLNRANLTGANLSGARLAGANLNRATLTRANLNDTTLIRANLDEAILTRARLRNATLTNANLDGATLTQANLDGATLTGANLNGATLTQANLSKATLVDTDLNGATLTQANLNGATLTEANLSGADLTHANLKRAMLNEVDLSRATLTDANLWMATLTDATLAGAALTGANLSATTLTGAVLLAPFQLAGAGLDGLTKLDDFVARQPWVRARIEACRAWPGIGPVPPPTAEPTVTP